MIRLVPHVWTETVDYLCFVCGHKAEGRIEIEETGIEWHDLTCGECGSEDLELERR